MSKSSYSCRERWEDVFNGGGTEGMVSPLCDNWRLDFPYTWPYDRADPFPPGHRYHQLSQEMAMARICGWDATFLCGLDLRNTADAPKQYTRQYYIRGGNNVYEETKIETPYGDLTQLILRSDRTYHAEKPWLVRREDYQKAIWYTKTVLSHVDVDTAIADGKALAKAVGEEGILGTGFGSSGKFSNKDEMFYHLADWPDEYREYLAVTEEYQMKMLDVFAEAGYDYIFACMDGTDWLSPWYVEQIEIPFFKRIIAKWRKSGGRVMWHSCGHVGKYIENGYFYDLMPDILETVSEPPVGNVKSLKWARGLTDPKIVTKGNMALNTLLEGTEDDVRSAVSDIKAQTKGTRHVVGLSDAILENTPLKNCLAFVDEARAICV